MPKKTYDKSLLKDEYVMLQNFYEEIDEKGLNIKNWSITVALASVGAGLFYDKNVLLLASAAAFMFWVLEAYWRGLSYFYVVRIKDIEKAFSEGREEKEIPFQVYSAWNREFRKSGDQTIRYMFKFSSVLPHVPIMIVSLALYFLNVHLKI